MKLATIYEPIRDDLERVDEYLRRGVHAIARELGVGSHLDGFAKKAVNHLFDRPGKGLRPALLMLSAAMANPEISGEGREALVRTGAVVELVHSASLVHDDVIDESDRRRSAASVNRRFGTKTAILVGDILFTHAFDTLAGLPDTSAQLKVRLFGLFADLTKRMCYGELLEQQAVKSSRSLSLDSYIAILEGKTALLMSVSCECGALLAGGSEETIDLCRRFGLDFGLAYQLADDYADGDAPYRGAVDLMAETRRHLDGAKRTLETVEASIFTKRLLALSEFIFERALKKNRG